MVIAILNQKGGVGKTTTTLNLGAALAEAGWRVLMVDLDPQRSLLFHAEGEPEAKKSGRNEGSDLRVIESSGRGLDALLRRQHDDFPFDYALLDCPPALTQATASALKNAHLALAPTPPRVLDFAGLAQLRASVAAVRGRGNPGLQLRILITMRDARIALQADYEAQLRAAFSGEMFRTSIPRAALFERAADAHRPVLAFASSSAGAVAYRALAQEVMQLGQPV